MQRLVYWISTGLLSLAFAVSGVANLLQIESVRDVVEGLGYPLEMMTLLGFLKLAGVVIILMPGYPRLKEWAYAGFAFNLLGALWSHLSFGDSLSTVSAPIALLILVALSYSLRPESRKMG